MYNIITIERQYGSGGNEIGKKLAAALGYKIGDRSILVEAAKRLEIPFVYLENLEETSPGSSLFNLSQTALAGNTKLSNSLPFVTQLFLTEKDIMLEMAEKSNCVFVGRCASAIFRERTDCLNVFVHADKKFRIDRAIHHEKIAPAEAEATLKKFDKRRSSFYQTHAGEPWGESEHTMISLDSGKLGIDRCVALLKEAVQ